MHTLEVLLSHPSDLASEEHNAICQALMDYNSQLGQYTGYHLTPLFWRESSYCQFGERPQQSLNRQLVDRCHMVVAVFKHRLGSPTLMHESGTVEEIDEARRQNKQIFLYYSSQEPDTVGLPPETRQKVEQEYSRLSAFLDRIRGFALGKSFGSAAELRARVLQDLQNFHSHMGDYFNELNHRRDVHPNLPTSTCPSGSLNPNTVTISNSDQITSSSILVNSQVTFNSDPPVARNPIDCQLDSAVKKSK